MFKFKKNSRKGFSLVELIVVIAIMAVIAVVLVPALLSYVEESRAGKDMKTTDELVNSVELALTDQDVYDELLEHTIEDNISCYVDRINESECTSKTTVKAANDNFSEWYEFSDDDRQADETPYYGAGNMRGVTITFSPVKSSNESEYVLKDGVINKFVGRNTGYLSENEKLYNAIRSIMGDVMNNSSQTYRNSDFTIFIRMGTTGGNEASQQDAIKVYGQFNGTNLPYDDTELCKITSNRVVGDAGINDSHVNEMISSTNASKLNFSETSLMGSGTVYNSGANVYDLMKKEASEAYINDLKSNNEMGYYSTLSLAVADVNNNLINTNDNSNESDASIAVYMDEGIPHVVLLKNTTETSRLTISKDMTFDLAGNVLSFENSVVGIDATAGKLTIVGEIDGSRIQMLGTDSTNAIAVQANTDIVINGGNKLSISCESDSGQSRALNINGGSAKIDNCKVSSFSKNYAAFGMYGYATLTNCEINVKSDGQYSFGIYNTGGMLTVENCDITTTSQNGSAECINSYETSNISNSNIKASSNTARSVGIAQADNSTVTIANCSIDISSKENRAFGVLQFSNCTNQTITATNCDIIAKANFELNDEGNINIYGVGIYGYHSTNNIMLNNCRIMGTWVAVITCGRLDVNGGTYEGYCHGGFLFKNSEQDAYIKNATIKNCDMPEGYFGSESSDKDAMAIPVSNVMIYMDNCDIDGILNNIHFYYAASNSKMYISNSKVDLTSNIALGSEETTNELYIGVGCNFTADNVNRPNSVYMTEETYIKE